MKYISRSTYYDCLTDAKKLKALAMLIYIKNMYSNSVITNFTYYKLAKITGLTQATAKKYFKVLESMELVERLNTNSNNVLFKRIRREYNNIVITKAIKGCIKDIEKGLRALFIVEKQSQKDYIKHTMEQANGDVRCSYKQMKRAKNKVKGCGRSIFKDNGFCYEYLCKKLNISRKSVSETIKFGESNFMFVKQKNVEKVYVKGFGYKMAEYNNRFTFGTRNYAFIVSANTYRIIR